MPVYIMPGWADGVVGLALGYGRTAAGSVGGLAEAGCRLRWVSMRTRCVPRKPCIVATGLTCDRNGGALSAVRHAGPSCH